MKTTTSKYQEFTKKITDQIINELQNGQAIWKQPWANLGSCCNYITKRPYSGFNQFYLAWVMKDRCLSQPFFMTYKQAQEKGGTVRKGSKGITVVFWKKLESITTSLTNEKTPNTRMFPFLHTVFNIDQIDGIDFIIDTENRTAHTPISACERIVLGMQDRPLIQHGGNEAFYMRSQDLVQLPMPEQFTCAEKYYQTAFHELIHATGHKKRLDRFNEDSPAKFGDEAYSKEELIAEIGATMLSAKAGIHEELIPASAAYIKGWLKALKNDHTMIFSAANQAEKALQYILSADDQTEADRISLIKQEATF